jgi:putative transposase
MSFVAAHRDRFGVEPILRVLEVPTSTFYGWLAQQRDPCQQRRQDAWLAGKIRAVHKGSGGTYGAPRSTRSCAATVSGPPASGWSG